MEITGINDLGLLLQKIDNKPLEIEIGSGNGHFISQYAKINAQKTIIGIEIKKKRCFKIAKKIENNNLTNVNIYHGDALALIQRLRPNSVDAYHFYFPDPWPKTKHRKRRFLKQKNINLLYKTLKEYGAIFLVSDIFDYFMQVKILLLLHRGFKLVDMIPPQEIFDSLYYRRYIKRGKTIYSLFVRKMG